MSELDDRYERGQETRRMFGGGQISGGSSPGAWDIAPDLERILGEALFGTIWKRPALTPVQREMITLSCLIVMNREVQLKRHLSNALNVGLTPDQVVESIIHDTWYGGAPAGIQALTLCKEVFEERGIEFTPTRIHDASEDPDSLFQRGDEFRRSYMGITSTARPAPPTEAERELGRTTGFKAQVVAPSRAAAMRYAGNLNDFGLNAYPIITTLPNDGAEFQMARGLDQETVANAFVDPEGEPEVLVEDMLLTGFDAPVEQVLYLDKSLRDNGLLQAITRVNRRFSHRQDDVETEKTYGLVVDYHGVSRDLEEALSTFDWPDVQESMWELEEDPGPLMEAAAIQAESHFKGRGLNDTWACVAVFAPNATTEGDYKADLFEGFNADYRRFSRLMDCFLPDPRALAYAARLARLTEIRAYARAQFLREDADVDWTEIGAKVKKLVDERISTQAREMMKPLSILDQDFDQKIAALPHDEARASVMEHAIRAQSHERLAENPVFYERRSERLARIIQDLRNRLIETAEACRRMAALRHDVEKVADIAAQHGMTTVSFAIYQLLDEFPAGQTMKSRAGEEQKGYRTEIDEETKRVSREVERVIAQHRDVIDWQSNLDVQREMRRDIKRELRPTGDYTEEQLDELASRSGYDH